MTDERPTPAPTRLAQISAQLNEVFHDAEAEYRSEIDEGRAWQRLAPRLVLDRQRSWRRLLLTPVVAASMLLACWFGWRSWGSKPLPLAVAPTDLRTQIGVAASGTTRSLAAGKSRLPDGTVVELGDGAHGMFTSDAVSSTLEFDAGRLDIAVARQPKGRHFAVKTQGYEFLVLGTRFTVIAQGTKVELNVNEGRVRVRQRAATSPTLPANAASDPTTVGAAAGAPVSADAASRSANSNASPTASDEPVIEAGTPARSYADSARPPTASDEPVIEAGGHWSSLDGPRVVARPTPSAQRPAVVEPKATPSAIHEAALDDPSHCRDLLRSGEARSAERCYLGIAAGNGLGAEMALYEVSRLRRDVLGNPTSALAALDEYASRFSAGTLLPEVSMARVDLLARLGRFDDALEASGQLLATPSGRARMVELRLLRGNLLRDKSHDLAAAIAEYQQIASDPGPRGDQAAFALAGCQQQLGRSDEAIRTYRAYLERPKPLQADRARRLLKDLEP